MSEAPHMHGSSDFYLAVAGLVPLLAITFAINLSPLQTANTYFEVVAAQAKRWSDAASRRYERDRSPKNRRRSKRARRNLNLMQLTHPIQGLVVALLFVGGAIASEIAALAALYGPRSTSGEAVTATVGLGAIGAALFLHCVSLANIALYRAIARREEGEGHSRPRPSPRPGH